MKINYVFCKPCDTIVVLTKDNECEKCGTFLERKNCIKNEKFRVAVMTKKGNIKSNNFNTKEEVDDYLLELEEKEGLKRYRIIVRKTREVIEDEKGVRK